MNSYEFNEKESGDNRKVYVISSMRLPSTEDNQLWHFFVLIGQLNLSYTSGVQRKSVLQPAILASCSYPVLAHKSFQLAPKPFLISRIDYNPSVI